MMGEKTYIAHAIEGNDGKDAYDAEVKKVLSDKTILAWIMKYSMTEFMEYSLEEVRHCIEEEPKVSSMKLRAGHTPEAITGMPTESQIPGEGEITYDIRFYAITPTKEQIKILINIEAQKNYYPGYDLVTRAVFYCARMLSAQLDTEFTPRNYDEIKKVYSIWICMDVPDYAAYTMTGYGMQKKEIYGHMPRKARYDLLEVVMICLGKQKEAHRGNRLQGMLSVLLSDSLKPGEKESILEQEYQIKMSVEVKGGIQTMCNLSERIEQRGIAKGIEQGIEQGIERGTERTLFSLVKQGLLKLEDAANQMGLSGEDFGERMKKAGY